jgi:hypothetical protein
MSVKFMYFERVDVKSRTHEIVTYAGYLGASEEMEDVELRLTIDTHGDMNVKLENDHYYNSEELNDINYCIESLNWSEPVEDILFVNLLEDDLTPPYKLFKRLDTTF